ncbi:SDR family oxidoreductase [Micromonospora echinofusca]|uniref:SDR family oxidoreductase n=1 Tax=Micromonospora echinofusca TaxID=47858 RepID=A0ABS3VTM1_MICEH|nr:SDR family oxidoreductase [Micromonospora echinofusca]
MDLSDTKRSRLDGLTAVITGGTRGLGRALTEGFLDSGASVLAAARTEGDFGEIADRYGERAAFHPVDVCDADSLNRLMSAAVEQFGRLDIVVANAGVTRNGLIHKMSPTEWRDVMNTNLDGLFHTVQAALPHFGESGGSILTVSSGMASYAAPGASAYIASKAATEAFTRCCAAEFANRNIRVNCISPGILTVGMGAAVGANERLRQLYWPRMLAGRAGEPHEVVAAAVFLASPAASYINGHVLDVTGGLR